MIRRDYRYVVVGLGGLGSAAAYWLAKAAGHDVLGLEQFEFGHVRGESEDHSRIFRLSYHTPGYVAFAKRSLETWRLLEQEAQEPLVIRTGGLDLAPANTKIPLDPYYNSLTANQVPFERLQPSEIRRRWPFQIGDDVAGLFQPDAGIALAARANAAHRRLALAHGATLLPSCPVTQVSQSGGEFVLETATGAFHGEKLILAPGPWTNQVLGMLGHKVPMEVTREQVHYYVAPDRASYSPDRFPVWIWMDEPCFYGLPDWNGTGVKVGQDVGGKPTTVDGRDFLSDPEYAARVERFMAGLLPGVGGEAHVRTCLYSLTPDRDFVIDTLPGLPNVLLAMGAGHAFKFASVIGRTLAELAIDGRTPSDVSAFRFSRPILQLEHPPVSYMV